MKNKIVLILPVFSLVTACSSMQMPNSDTKEWIYPVNTPYDQEMYSNNTIEKTDYKTLLIVAGTMATYPLLIERAGFIVASTVAFFGVSFAFGAKNVPKNLLVSLIFSLIVYFSFTRGLNVNLPSGILRGI